MAMANVGVLGGGQLGRMLALAGYPLGCRFQFVEREADCPAGHLASVIPGEYDDPAVLARLLDSRPDVVTYEFENVPVAAADWLAARVPVYPPPGALEVAQDRWHEKTTFRALGIPTPQFHPVGLRQELDDALRQVGFPAVLKTRRMGYDGKGQALLRSPEDVDRAWAALSAQPLILEEFVRLRRELAILGVRARNGREAFYDLTQTEHVGGILHVAKAPADIAPETQARASEYMRRLLDHLNYVGVLALELFETEDGRLLASEIAPRVHNSGHWTMDGAVTSQFENHLRAVLGWELGDPSARGFSAMLNLIGDAPPLPALAELAWAKLHWYGKTPRPGRKLGHVNIVASTREDLDAKLATLRQRIAPPSA
jgi:5-(carboxyamino)imidazole ribonucleotide synthase